MNLILPQKSQAQMELARRCDLVAQNTVGWFVLGVGILLGTLGMHLYSS